jgi:hypothetical protein
LYNSGSNGSASDEDNDECFLELIDSSGLHCSSSMREESQQFLPGGKLLCGSATHPQCLQDPHERNSAGGLRMVEAHPMSCSGFDVMKPIAWAE